ncbi:serine/threonine protein kinase [Fusarium oxysporum f. sp. conglutinans race 2 54008]|uniref:EKC/KEOPS complex subunit BUD32 n=1 Tax=Fusarium oxysporum f. sp. conglutinans race 2 54008 TaxID=1089457 RepID=X0GMZ9_FUSOX|nr:serine/threonine protein kinase [Fusarium oxysporum f. sp. conglutinans race 2 54008]
MINSTEPDWRGSSSNIYKFEPGKVIKVPRQVPTDNDAHKIFNGVRAQKFEVERGIYEVLGAHDLILPFYGCRDFNGQQGLLLAQADSTLQEHLEHKFEMTTEVERRRWCYQAADSVAYLHKCGVMHSDLRPENFLIHERNVWLSDFNGSVCEDPALDGGQLPDAGFWNSKLETTPDTDIFALGSVLYAIVTGWWPFCRPGVVGRLDRKDKNTYDEEATKRFQAGEFPDTSSLWGGDVILGCWNGRYKTVLDIKRDLAFLDTGKDC